jgi:2-oxoglutarate ferredoxin oxidoreductase subunit alpha
MMQARWGSHGDYEIIALAPASPQEMFDLTVTAFNLSETYRTPVFIMSDEIVGHMSEKVTIPGAAGIRTVSRPKPKGRREHCQPFKPGPNGVAPMPAIGEGYNVHVTGLTHNQKGYPVMSVATQKEMIDRLMGKIRNNLEEIVMTEDYRLDDAEVAIVSYGVSARTSYTAVDQARAMGIKAGLLRLVTVWPFAEARIRELAQRMKGFITVEINMGQIGREVQRCAGVTPCITVGHAGGAIIPPEDVLTALGKMYR